MSKFAVPFFVAAALAVPLSPSLAQTGPQTEGSSKPSQPGATANKGNPSQPGTIGGAQGSTGASTAVGTEQPTIEVLQHIRAGGYSALQLKPDSVRGGWSGTAQKNGREVKLHVAPNGNVEEKK
jgi:hypothetical protein